MRYFLAKQVAGPCLIVAERIDEIAAWLKQEGLAEQFHPSYTRMVPAHHILELALIGCPDPSPSCTRFFTPQRNRLSSNLDEIGRAYIGAMQQEVYRWLEQIPTTAPIGVLFSGGIDSGAVFLAMYDALLKRGESPGRLKAFTLSLDDFVISFFVNGKGWQTLPVYIWGQIRRGVTPEINAISTLMLAFSIMLVVISQVLQRRDR